MENEELTKLSEVNTRFNIAVMDVLAIICNTLKDIDNQNACFLSEKLKALAQINDTAHAKEFSTLALHLSGMLDDPDSSKLLSSGLRPSQLSPEQVRDHLSVVPPREE